MSWKLHEFHREEPNGSLVILVFYQTVFHENDIDIRW